MISRQELDKPAGMLMAAGSEHAVSFYENPVLLHLASGKVIHEWPDIPTDKRNSSISHHVLNSIIAADAENKRFAVATSNSIEVVTLG